MLREIYRRAELPLTDAALADLHAYLAARETKSTDKLAYDLKRDFGLEAEDIRKPFGFYFERFPVQVEVK